MPNLPIDRDLVISLATQVMGWNRQSRDHGWMTVEDRERCISANSDWNPLTSPLDALELEGMVPEEKRWWYQLNLIQRCGLFGKIPSREPKVGKWVITVAELQALLRRTPRQIAEAVWLTCVKEGK